MQIIKKKQKKISKTNENESTISKTVSVKNLFIIHKKTWTKFSSKKRKRIRLKSQLRKNVIETNSQFVVMKRKVQKKKHKKNKTKLKTRKHNKFKTNFQNFEKTKYKFHERKYFSEKTSNHERWIFFFHHFNRYYQFRLIFMKELRRMSTH